MILKQTNLSKLYALVLLLTLGACSNTKNSNDSSDDPPVDHMVVDLDFQSDSTILVIAKYTIREVKSDTIHFLLNPGYKLNQISAEGMISQGMGMKPGRPFPFHLLTFDGSQPRQNLTVEFDYLIDLKTVNHIKSNWLEFNVDKLWHPNYNDINNEFSWELNIENLYDGYSLVSYELDNGIIRPQIFAEGKKNLSIKHSEPSPEVYFMAGKDMKVWAFENEGSEIGLKFFTHRDTPESVMTSIGQKTVQTIDLLNDLFGQAKPIEDYLLIMRNTPRGEIGFLQSRGEILLGGTYYDSFAALSHEVAHYWWTGADFINEPWMNEGFANFSMFLTLDFYEKAKLEEQLERSTKAAESAGPVRSAGTFSGNNFNSYYHKASLMLWDLEEEIGREAMMVLLKKRIEKEINDTDGFLDLLEEQEGEEMRQFFEVKLDQ